MATINYLHTEEIHNTKSAEEVLPLIFNLIKPASVVDVGCGTGSWLSVAKKLGANVIQGIDGVNAETKIQCIERKDFKQHDLTLPLQPDRKYDLAICLEVAEHLPESAAENLIEILTEHSDIILFSAAIPNQGGQFHINEQWPDYWQKKFDRKGYLAFDLLRNAFWNNEKVEWWYQQNMFIYSKSDKIPINLSQPESDALSSRIHPQLFQKQVEIIQRQDRLIKDTIWNPRFLPTLKLLAKSLIKPTKDPKQPILDD